MLQQKLRRSGNSYIVTIPKDTVKQLGLQEGDLIGVQVQRLEIRPVLPPDLRSAFEASWSRNQDGYRYLAES